jgi:hypothetical protein
MEQQMNLRLEDTTAVVCEKCNGQLFKEVMMIRKVSRFITNQPQDTMAPIPVFACHECNHVNDEFLPPTLRSDYVEVVEETN